VTTELKPMSEETFAWYKTRSSPNYARDKVASGEWEEEDALDKARQMFDDLLPEGLETPDNYLFEIVDEWDDVTVGMLWFKIEERGGDRIAYVCDIFVKPEHQRKGHASRAFRALENKVTDYGVSGIGLNVFGNNVQAYRLYERLGYQPLNIFLWKPLAKGGL
jgi:ribosomal protein S18 acetylase RimI-like enzyme